jgi:hypothetical protein
MTNNVYLVFSEKPEHISTDEYHAWYTDHAQENIQSPGFVSAQRYRVREVTKGEISGDEQHLSVYEHEGPMSTWRTDLDARIARGDIQLPDWFKQITFRSWTCEPTGSLLLPKR